MPQKATHFLPILLSLILFSYGWTAVDARQANLEESFIYANSTPSIAAGDQCGAKISALLRNSLTAVEERRVVRIKISLYSLTNLQFINNLGQIALRGGQVEILLDRKQFETCTPRIKEKLLEINGYDRVTLKLLGTNVPNYFDCVTMHEKVAIFHMGDEIYVFTGSYNWSTLAKTKNYENCIGIKATPNHDRVRYMVNHFSQRFDQLWTLGTLVPKRREQERARTTPRPPPSGTRAAAVVAQTPTPSPVAGRTRTGISRRQQPATDDTA